MKPMLVVSLLACGISVVTSVRSSCEGLQDRPVSASLELPTAITLGEPVVGVLQIENRSPETVTFDLGFNLRARLGVTISSPDGRTQTARLSETGLGRRKSVSVDPFQTYTQRLLLNDWFSFEQIGDYAISARIETAIYASNAVLLQGATTPTVQLRILPKDPRALRDTCERLATTVVTSREAIDRIEGAQALAQVKDPIAVPFIRSILLQTTGSDWVLIPALGRMNTAEARGVLTEMADSSDPERASMVRSILRRFEFRFR